jgi:hypothetical protein
MNGIVTANIPISKIEVMPAAATAVEESLEGIIAPSVTETSLVDNQDVISNELDVADSLNGLSGSKVPMSASSDLRFCNMTVRRSSRTRSKCSSKDMSDVAHSLRMNALRNAEDKIESVASNH